jgi:hypothetical protein
MFTLSLIGLLAIAGCLVLGYYVMGMLLILAWIGLQALRSLRGWWW